MRRIAIALVALAGGPWLYAAPPADTAMPGAPPIRPAGVPGEIKRMLRLPAHGIQMIQTTDGRTLYVSDNGRYLIPGPVRDLWHGGAELTSLTQAAYLAERIDLVRLKLDPGELGALDYGEGESDVVAFVDPFCRHSAALLEDLPQLRERYRFRLVPLPVLGAESEAAALAIACHAESDSAAALDALLNGNAGLLPVPKAGSDCGQLSVQRALVTARLFGISGTPYLIAPDGRMRNGRPDDLASWLAGEGGRP